MSRYLSDESALNNNYRVTGVSFLTYFVLSAMLAPIGILSGPMAEHFDLPVTEVTRQFSWLTGGALVGSIIALLIFDYFSLKRLFSVIYGVIAIALFSLAAIDSLEYARYVLGIVGVGSGVGLAGAAITISHTYSEERRASMLVITDGCFSIAGFVTSWLAAWLISQQFGWSTTYQLLGFAAAAIFALAITSNFPTDTHIALAEVHAEKWPLPVWLCVVSLFLFTLGQSSMLYWLPNYATTELGAPPVKAGALVGQFWLGMFFAQIFVAWWVLKIGVRKLLSIAPVTAFIFSLPLWNYNDIDGLAVLALIWGFGNLALLKAILSRATEMVSTPSPRLVSLLLLGATVGTAVSPYVTSQIVEWTDNHTILMFSSGCYGLLLCLMWIANRSEA